MNTKYKHTQIEHFQLKAIKKGDKLFLPVTFDSLLDGGEVSVNTPAGYKRFSCFSFIIPEPAPKYDPCRKFREGDVVDVISAGRGRTAFLYLEEDETHGDGHWVVTADEDHSGRVNICYNGERCARVWYNMLELVTPVEELEPYTVVESYGRTDVMKGDYIIATYTDSHPHAKEAAEAERDRLNAEYRKEIGK